MWQDRSAATRGIEAGREAAALGDGTGRQRHTQERDRSATAAVANASLPTAANSLCTNKAKKEEKEGKEPRR